MQLFLGVDGGGTGCRARLITQKGETLGEGKSGPANISTNREGALANILDACRQCFDRAGMAVMADVPTAMGLAGVNVSGTVDWITPQLPFKRLRIVTDAVTMTHGALQGREGIVAAIGTGSVFAEWRGGTYRQYGGWGFMVGDEGSGAVLGRMLVARALRAHDEVVPMTPLLRGVLDDHPSAESLAAFAAKASPAEFGQLAPRLLQEDEAADLILTEAGELVEAMITRIQRDSTLPVAWVGGLGPLWEVRLGGQWPRLKAMGTSLDGALQLARDIS